MVSTGHGGSADVAIIGIGCRFPGGASSPGQLWQLLEAGTDATGDIPADRWDVDRYYFPRIPQPGRMNARRGGFLERTDLFDAVFFGISQRVANQMDPQQRLLMEVGWEALEDAGLPPDSLAGSKTGVFIGASSLNYAELQTAPGEIEGLAAHSATGMYMSILSNRLSYQLDLHGPSFTVDTACSSSLVAIHLACQSLRWGECDLALAGGVNLILTPQGGVALSQAGMLAPDGRSRAFDAAASGYTRGEGAGVVVLRPLAVALARRDRIYAVIRGTAVNQDGRTQGITLPNGTAQLMNVRAALADAGIPAREVGYVEAHGTGTPVGDPIEAAALGTAFAEDRPAGQPFLVGSVKTNIGHLEAAAGVAGLIKAALAIRHHRIPPSLHFDSPNPAIDFSRWQMTVPAEGCAWPAGYRHAVASVNSFGFGGTNANVVLSESPAGHAGGDTSGEQAGPPAVLTLSARSDDALRGLAASYAALLDKDPPGLGQLAGNLALRRAHHDRRLALVATSAAQAAVALDRFAAGIQAEPGLQTGGGPAQRRLAFVFNGQGPQWFAMGRRLLNDSAVFSAKVAECDELALPHLGWSIRDALTAPDAAASPVHQTRCLQPMMFTLQVALVELWKSWGIQPAGVIGHSMGEIAAAHACGALDLATALKVISLRARIQDAADSTGAMMFVALGSQQAAELCDRYPGQVWLSALNSPVASTLSGRRGALGKLAADLEASGVFARMLRVNCACHSPDMDPLQAELTTALRGVSGAAGVLPMYSTVTAELIDGKTLGTDYWWRNFREPVQFEPACRAMLADGFDAFVELSPHPVLSSAIKEIAAAAGVDAVVLPTLHRDKNEWETFGGAFAALYAAGSQVAWETRYPDPVPALDLPGHPWIQQSCWSESETSRQYRSGGQRHPMLKRIDATRPTWEIKWDDHRLTWVYQHDVLQSVLVPGAAYVEAALAAGRELTGQDCALEFVQFERACVLHAGEPMVSHIELSAEDGTFEVHSRSVRGAVWIRNARGRYYPAAAGDGEPPADLDDLRRRCPREYTAADVYGSMRQNGYAYGPAFSGISKLLVGQGEALALVRAPRQMAGRVGDYLFHPALMDACFQAAILPPADPAAPALLPLTCLPVGMDTARLRGQPGAVLWCHTRIRSMTASGLIADARVYDEHGKLAAEFTGLRARAVQQPPDSAADRIDQHYYQLTWQRDQAVRPSGQPAAVTMSPLDLRADLDRRGRDLAERLSRAAYTTGYQDELRQLCAAYITACLQGLGCGMEPGELLAAADLSDVLPRYRQALAAQLRMLADDGVLAPLGDGYRVQVRAEGDAARLWAAALDRHPGCVWELMLLRRTGERLRDVLTGQVDPLELLFPGGTADQAGPIYETSPAARFYNLLAQQAVRLLAASANPARTLRVLEAGGGTGGLTASLLPVLPADRCHYLFTDISAAFTSAARERFADYEFLACQTLDLEREPEEQGLAPGSYDLVVASDAIHATTDLKKTLLSLQDLLAPGGILLMIEAEPGSRWLDLTFGLTEGWWLFRDLRLRPDGPLLTGPAWQELLSSCGYRDVVALSDPDQEGSGRQTLLLAAAPEGAQSPASDDADPASTGDWLILGRQDGLGAELARRIHQHGGRATVTGHVTASARADGGTAGHAASYDSLVARPDLRGIVCLWDVEPAGLACSGAQIEELTEVASAQLAAILQALQRRHSSAWPRLYLLTRGAHAFRNDDVRLAGAPAWGLGLTIGLEFPQVRCKVLDLETMPVPGQADAVWLELRRDDGHGEIVLRQGERFTRQLLSLDASAVHLPVTPAALPAGHGFVLEKDEPSALDRLRYRAVQRQPPGRGQVEIRVISASLNFLDVMTATGQVPPLESAPGQRLGADCAGVITEVGEGVGDLAPGDAVVAISSAQGTVSSHLTLSRTSVAARPADLSFEEAATLPVAFLTASIALRKLARLQPGERVLIHSAAGGTGLAAIQLARYLGAEVFATAGDPRKRAFLRGLGVTHVMDSRSAGFADEIRSVTGGRGVDVVLSAATGELATRSIGCLAPYGRFVDIGKRDLIEDRRLGLRPFLNNLAYFSFDLRQMMVDQPDRVQHELTELLGLFQDRQLRPLPFRVYPATQAVTALKHLAAARHIGKIVIAMDDDQGVKVVTAPAAGGEQVRGTWLITGGLGGVGLAMASALADAGASGVVLAGRSGISGTAARAAVDDLRARGVETLVAKADVTDRDELAGLIERISRDLPPLRGVLHCAMVLDDALLTSLDRPRMARVLAPKVQGAWHLHELTAHLPLDAFILFSSATSVLGAVGQASYAAANAFLDHLAAALRQRGRPAIALNWGAVADTGYIARHPDIARQVAAGGLRGFSARQMFQALSFLRSGSYPQVGVFPMDWPAFFHSRGTSTQPRYARLAAAATSVPGGPIGPAAAGALLARLRAHQGQAQAELLTQELKVKVASVLGIPAGQLEDSLPLIDYLDSLLAAELTSWMDRETGAKITLMELMRGPSISELALDILSQLSNDSSENSGRLVSQPGATSPSSAATDLPQGHGRNLIHAAAVWHPPARPAEQRRGRGSGPLPARLAGQ